MKNTKHTPGPWIVNGRYIVGQTSETICDPHDFGINKKESTANAALIAAAPEMLEALEIALAELNRINKGNDSHDSNCVSCLAIGLAEQAISKAKGGTK